MGRAEPSRTNSLYACDANGWRCLPNISCTSNVLGYSMAAGSVCAQVNPGEKRWGLDAVIAPLYSCCSDWEHEVVLKLSMHNVND